MENGAGTDFTAAYLKNFIVSLGMKAPPHRSQHKQCMCLARALLQLQGRCLLPKFPQTLVPCSWSAVQIWRTVAIGSQDLPFGYGLGTQDPYDLLKTLKIVQQTEKYFLVLQVLYQALPGAF